MLCSSGCAVKIRNSAVLLRMSLLLSVMWKIYPELINHEKHERHEKNTANKAGLLLPDVSHEGAKRVIEVIPPPRFFFC